MASRTAAQYRFIRPDGSISRHPVLGRRTRARLAATRRIDITCGWLCGHRLDAVAVLIWRACGLWSSSKGTKRG